MPIIRPVREVRTIRSHEVFSAPDSPRRSALCTFIDGNDFIRPLANTFNIVLSRNIRKNIDIATEMAVGISLKYADRRVLLVNTYAGAELLKHSFSQCFRRF